MKLPGPDHPITITANPRRVRAQIGGQVIADTTDAVTLTEASYRPVQYFPRADVQMERLSPSALATYCPFKGNAAHFALATDGRSVEKAAWSYEDPYPAMEAIRGRIAFCPGDIEVVEIG